jgi:nuclear pore complex protein Nup50
MAKRTATSELNHENWNEEEKPEEAGTFRKAKPDVLQHRIIKSAKRRSVGATEDVSKTSLVISMCKVVCGFSLS